MPTVALAAAAAAVDDEDTPPLAAALAAEGIGAAVAVWDDPGVDWASFDLVVVRSTWDYAARREAFLGWAGRVADVTRLHNPPDVLRWNTDKRYLRELGEAGLPVVSTTWIEPADPVDLPDAGEYVVKPAVSAGSRDTARYGPGDVDRARVHVDALQAAGRTVMVQPFLAGVDAAGETALIYIDGTFSHAVRKGPLLALGAGLEPGLYRKEDIEPKTPSESELAAGKRVMAAVDRRVGTLLYARVDLVPGADGEPILLEVELAEPSLFLPYAQGAAQRLAAAIARRLPPTDG